jgi:DNA-binding transcriptional LysR family regulator
MVLTDAGKVLYDIADKIFQFESRAEEKIRGGGGATLMNLKRKGKEIKAFLF